MSRILVILILLFSLPAHANVSFHGVSMTSNSSSDGFVVPRKNLSGDWTQCSQLVAYWSMDETGTSDRESTSGSCTDDCDLTAAGSATSVGDALSCRGADMPDNTANMSCTDATCDELDFAAEDFSITGYFKAQTTTTDNCGVVSKESGSNGYRLSAPYISASDHDVKLRVEDNELTIADVGDTGSWFFIGASWDESADDMDLCVGGSDAVPTQSGSFWSCSSNTSATGPITATSSNFESLSADGANCHGGSVDDLAIWSINLTETEKCYICACRPTGDDCGVVNGIVKSSRFRRWKDYCGGCTLPTVVPSCPTGD